MVENYNVLVDLESFLNDFEFFNDFDLVYYDYTNATKKVNSGRCSSLLKKCNRTPFKYSQLQLNGVPYGPGALPDSEFPT